MRWIGLRWISLYAGLVLLAAICLPLISCNSGLPEGLRSGSGGAQATPAANISQGFDLGVALTDPVLGVSIAGARIPRSGGQDDLEVMFVAFTTDADAEDADGAGTPLDRTPVPTPDSNGASDVFLAVVAPSVVTTATGSAPTAFSQALVNTFHADRCVNCHSFHNSGMGQHTGGSSPGNNNDCTSCHTAGATGNVVWLAPISDVANDFDFRDKSTEELCAAAQNIDGGAPESVREHLKTDDKILWAITSGAIPDNGPNGEAALPHAPIALRDWFAQVDAWVDGGFQCDTAEAILDVKVASRVSTGSSTTNGASGAPSIAFLPNAFYAPDPSASTFAGFLCVAFESTGTDVIAGTPGSGRNIYWTAFSVMADQDANGAFSPGSMNLSYFFTLLVSHTSANFSASANADSMRPVLSSNGIQVVFESKATNLFAGFTDRNGADGTDVFLWNEGNQSVNLVSRANSVAGVAGGDGSSSFGAIRSSGNNSIIAFESEATDLVVPDTNGVSDVFYTTHSTLSAATVSLARASVRSGGAEASGGASGRPSVAITSASPFEFLIAFQSAKTNLVTGAGTLPATSVYVHDALALGGGATTLVSRAGLSTLTANGASAAPSLAVDGRSVIFESLATNIDYLRTGDSNGKRDVFLADLTEIGSGGAIRSRRVSLASNGLDGNGASQAAAGSAYLLPSSVPGNNGFLIYSTQATNLGAPEGVGLVLLNVRDLFNPDATPGNALPICPPAAVETVSPGTPAPFDATACFDPNPGDSIVSFEWEFDDGDSATGMIVSHTFATLGVHSAELTITDEIGDAATAVVSVLVDTPPECEFTFTGTLAVGLNVDFDASASFDVDAGDAIASYAWDFGDDTGVVTNAFPTVSHPYIDNGVYSAELTVTDASGTASTCTQLVTIGTPTFSDVSFIFAGNCDGGLCHGANPLPYNSIVNVASSNCNNLIYVVPGDPDASYLFQKMSSTSPPCGTQMPPSGLLSAAQIATVREWIEAGAEDN